MKKILSQHDQWMLAGALCGMASIVAYLAAAFVPMPTIVSHACAFAFGPLLAVGCLGLHHALTIERQSVMVSIATLMALGGAVTLLNMITTQQSIFILTDQAPQFSSAGALGALEQAVMNVESLSRTGLNAVQLGMDVAWDVLISLAMMLYAAAMWSHRAYGKILSVSGMALGALLLGFNLWYFPVPPAEAESIDWGPFAALWLLTVFAFTLAFRLSKSRPSLNS